MYSGLKVVHQLFSEEQLLDKNIEILDSQVHQHHDIATFDLKSKRANIRTIRGIEKIRRITEVERIERVRRIEEAIKKIS